MKAKGIKDKLRSVKVDYYSGKCLCGQISYDIESEAQTTAMACHCKNCQRQAGSAFSIILAVPKHAIKWTGATPKRYLHAGDSGRSVLRFFCGNCGSPVYTELPAHADMLYIKAGTLDNTEGFMPYLHIWCDSRQQWVVLPEGAKQVPTQ